MICRCASDSAPTSAAAASAAAATARHRGRRLEVLAERPDAQEVHVAGRLLAAAGVVVGGARVVGHGVAGLHAQLLHVEGVAGGHFLEPLGAAVERHDLLGRAVHRVDELEVLDAEVVVGARLDEELLDRRGVAVAPGLGDRHRRRHVGEHVDHVLRRGGDHRPVGALQADAVEAVLVGDERPGELALGAGRERHVGALVQRQLAGRGRHRRRDRDAHFGAGQHGDVAGVLDHPRFEAGVGGEVVLEVDALGVGQVDDVEREGARTHAGGLGQELELGVEVEDHALEAAVVALEHRHPLERRRVALAHEQHGVVGAEAAQRRLEQLIGAARHRAAPGREGDAVRRRGLDALPREHRRQARGAGSPGRG